MIVSLPAHLDEWIASRAQRDGFEGPTDFIVEMLERERDSSLEDAVAAGEASGVSERSFDEIIADARSRMRAVAR